MTSTLPLWGIRQFRARPALVLLTGQVVAAVVAFAVNIMSAAIMDPAGRGDLAFLLQVTYLLTVVSMLGIERPYIARRHAPFSTAVSEVSLLFRPGLWVVSVPIVIASVMLVIGEVHPALSMLLVAAFMLGNMHVGAIRVAYIASGALKFFVLSAFVSQLALLVMSAALFLFGVQDPNLWFLAYALMGLIAIATVVLNRDRGIVGPVRSTGNLSEIRRQGFRLLPASLGNTAMLRSDRLLIPLLASSSQLGIYVVVATVMELASWPVQQWVDASLRRWNGAASPSFAVGFRMLAKAAALVAVLSIAFGGLAYLTVVWLLPKAYLEALVLIIPLGIAAVFYAMTRVQQGLLIAQGHSGRVSLVEIIGMAASVAMYLILIPGMGAMGAALGSAIGYFACLVSGAIVFVLGRRAATRG